MSTSAGAYPIGPLPAGTVTFLFTDIVGSSTLWETQRDAMRGALSRHDALMRDCIGRHHGHVVKTTGDGFHAAFAVASDAIEAAIAAQCALHREAWPDGATIRARMALHTGVAELRDGDYYGPAVNRAARLAALGHGGQTLLSEITHQLCRDAAPPRTTFRRLGEHHLKGLARPEAVYEVHHPDLPQSFPPLQTLLAPIDERTPSIAVLPFTDLSPGRDQEYFADGLAEELLNVLSRVSGMRVASRTSAFSFKGTKLDLPAVAHKLNVATVLEGSVRKAGTRVRVGAHLVSAANDAQIWSNSYDRELDDIFAVQDEIAQSVVAELKPLLGAGAEASAERAKAEIGNAIAGRSRDATAWESYLLGRQSADRFTAADTERGIAQYLRAIELDPGFALAWACLARAYADQGAYAWAPAAEAFERARNAAEHALQLNPDQAEAHAVLGLCRLAHDRNWRGAEASFRRALELAPGNSLVLRHAAILAACLGRNDESIALLRRAVALDPLSVPAWRVLGQRLLFEGRLGEADAAFEKTLALNPDGGFTHYWLGMSRLAAGRIVDARAAFSREVNEVFALLGRVAGAHAAGERDTMQAALDALARDHADDAAFQVASAYACAEDADSAFAWLDRADQARDPGLVEIKAEILLRGLYHEARWPALLVRLGLDDRDRT
jgi:TolB-like protein/class 3 adenylate cyclase/Tfp pilus assembly protein PilF